jgi:hypothetical protein
MEGKLSLLNIIILSILAILIIGLVFVFVKTLVLFMLWVAPWWLWLTALCGLIAYCLYQQESK